MYGTGLRLMECVRLRVKDVDFEQNQITVREGKGFKDRVSMLPGGIKEPLAEHLKRVKLLHEQWKHGAGPSGPQRCFDDPNLYACDGQAGIGCSQPIG